MNQLTRKEGNNARVTDHPEWSASQPWVSYINGTAGRHFACPEDADAYFKEKGFSRVADITTGGARGPAQSQARRP